MARRLAPRSLCGYSRHGIARGRFEGGMVKVALTNAGHARALSLLRHPERSGPGKRPVFLGDPLVRLTSVLLLPFDGGPEQRALLSQGLVRTLPDSTDANSIARSLRRNPIGQVSQAAIEFTTRCNFGCAHCYNSGVDRVTETDVEALGRATDSLADIGVREFTFVGGEVSKFGDGWLDLARRIKLRGASVIGLITNGWWLGRGAFEAAGQSYGHAGGYLADLRSHGVTHICFSIDGRGAEHDRSRNLPGLYERIVGGFETVLEAGLQPRVSLLSRAGGKDEAKAHFDELSGLMYRHGQGAASLMFDRTNLVNEFIDLAGEGEGTLHAADCSEASLRCAGFFRPSPQLTLKANGELATCRLANAGEGYGNFHERSLVEILNGMQESFVYRLHAERLIAGYARFVDPGIFAKGFAHPCAARAIVTMIARRMHEEGIGEGDVDSLARVNREVALTCGRTLPALRA